MVKKFFHGINFVFILLIYFTSFPLAYLLYGAKKLWIISEVDFDARDNGIHFFKYLAKEHPEVNAVYLISRRNPNYDAVRNIGRVVEPHSYQHMLMFIAARAKISTLVHGCSPSWCITKYLLKHHPTGKNIALKHGIFKNLHPNYFKKNAHLDMICCGGEPEFEFIDKNFGYDRGVAKYTGLARFDALHNVQPKKEIFIMPTWRRWLDGIQDQAQFEKSKYYLNWVSFLRSTYLKEQINQNDFDICFYIHPKLNKFLRSFNGIDEKIRFLSSKEGDSVQTHLKEAAVMITDFSSVFFDFAYMRKPAIYFQFDEEQYYESHYTKAYFDYRENGFGPVSVTPDQTIEELKKIIENDLKMESRYFNRAKDFFPLYDDRNCERIYQSIIEVIDQ